MAMYPAIQPRLFERICFCLTPLFLVFLWQGCATAQSSILQGSLFFSDGSKFYPVSANSEEDESAPKDFAMKSWYRPEEDHSEKEKAKMAQRLKAAFRELQSLSPEKRDKRIEAALEILRNYDLDRFYYEKQMERSLKIQSQPSLANKLPPNPPPIDNVHMASAMRTLIEIGKPGIPKLIEELDQTDRYLTLQALGFVLRSINDPRAIPALIRAIPRTLQPEDCGYPFSISVKKRSRLGQFHAKIRSIQLGRNIPPTTKINIFSSVKGGRTWTPWRSLRIASWM